MEYVTLVPINKLKTNELWISQPKWYRSNFELTDQVFVYAKIYTTGFWHTTTVLEATDGKLSIQSLWSGALEIKAADGTLLGEIKTKGLSGVTTFTLKDGKIFSYKAPSVWKSEYIWEDELGNELIRMDFGAFSGKTSVSFGKSAAEIPNFYALMLIAYKLKMDNAAHG